MNRSLAVATHRQDGPVGEHCEVDLEHLTQVVEKVVRSAPWRSSAKSDELDARRSHRSEVLLGVLTHAYVVGLYGTAQIMHRLLADPSTRALCSQLDIDSYSLGRFRRVNVDLICSCILKVFQVLFPVQGADGGCVPGQVEIAHLQALEQEAAARLRRAADADRRHLEALFFTPITPCHD